MRHFILGIGGYSHDASAALLCDGKIVAAVQEERLNRIKHSPGFPNESIKYCLEAGNIKPKDITAISFYCKKTNWDNILLHTLKASASNVKHTVCNLKGFRDSIGYRVIKSLNFRADYARFFYETGFSKKIFYDYDHHACHAASGFYSSPFDEAVILCIDSVGDNKSTSYWAGGGNTIKEIMPATKSPHSIARVYNRITKYLGFHSTGDEYKVMGLAAYGKPVYYDRMKNLIVLQDDGYKLNMKYFIYQYEYSLSDKFYEEFGPPRKKGDEITGHYADIAASVQRLFEEVLMHLALLLKKKTSMKNLVISGGAALNCKGNGGLLRSNEFDNIFVPPAASDLGTSIGAAQYHYHQVMGMPRDFSLKVDGWGPGFTDEQISLELNRAGLGYRVVENPAIAASELIAKGMIIGWFQGRMEFGPRALGYRSILADPRKKEIKDKINKTIKFREEFRPFAPSILREHVKDYFGSDLDCPFMTYTLEVLPGKRDDIQGVVHVDGSGRVQTVSREDQPLYHELIHHFYKLTGVPAVLNTSFNLAGEPIVCSPFDAIRTFFTCGMDALVIGKYLISKREL